VARQCIDNASAPNLAPLSESTVKQFDLLHHVNARDTFVATKACLRYLLGSDHAAVLGLSPPLAVDCVLGAVPEPGWVIAASAPAPAIPDRTDAEGQQ
jgi:hypothetical protein